MLIVPLIGAAVLALAALGLGLWAWQVARRHQARWLRWLSIALWALTALPVAGAVLASLHGSAALRGTVSPEQRAPVLAAAISESINCVAAGVVLCLLALIAIAGGSARLSRARPR